MEEGGGGVEWGGGGWRMVEEGGWEFSGWRTMEGDGGGARWMRMEVGKWWRGVEDSGGEHIFIKPVPISLE